MRFLRLLEGSPRLTLVRSDAWLEILAEEILERHSDQDFSYADAVGFAIVMGRGIEAAFTFDRRFAAMGSRMALGQSPRTA